MNKARELPKGDMMLFCGDCQRRTQHTAVSTDTPTDFPVYECVVCDGGRINQVVLPTRPTDVPQVKLGELGHIAKQRETQVLRKAVGLPQFTVNGIYEALKPTTHTFMAIDTAVHDLCAAGLLYDLGNKGIYRLTGLGQIHLQREAEGR